MTGHMMQAASVPNQLHAALCIWSFAEEVKTCALVLNKQQLSCSECVWEISIHAGASEDFVHSLVCEARSKHGCILSDTLLRHAAVSLQCFAAETLIGHITEVIIFPTDIALMLAPTYAALFTPDCSAVN